ncbi:hypothetical protein Trydic_g22470 [Trypoxylus dichotomus]
MCEDYVNRCQKRWSIATRRRAKTSDSYKNPPFSKRECIAIILKTRGSRGGADIRRRYDRSAKTAASFIPKLAAVDCDRRIIQNVLGIAKRTESKL